MKNGQPIIEPGKLRHRITFLYPESTLGDSGMETSYSTGNVPVCTYAEIEPVKASELLKSGQEVGQLLVKVTIRYRASVNASLRIQIPSGAVYIIQAIENVLGLNRYMVMTCLGVGANA